MSDYPLFINVRIDPSICGFISDFTTDTIKITNKKKTEQRKKERPSRQERGLLFLNNEHIK